ncbi:MAG: lipid A biosynthesis acyltransferase [Pyrinomonas sp.]|uniref:lysophospholipid acyltransferase family protein n=1 Tax=Pyrinomonas sp. TaxID=2080306 RepID=UPI0033230374
MSEKGATRIALEYWATRSLLAALAALPRPLAVCSGACLGLAAYHLARRLRRTGERNLELAFPTSDRKARQQTLRRTFINLGRQLGEFSQFFRATPERLRCYVDLVGREHFERAREQGRGVIFLTAHLGAWELLSFAGAAFGIPQHVIVRRIDNARIEALVESVRTRFGNRIIDKRSAARRALRVLQQGGTLGVLADLNTQPHEGVFVPFFGRLACTTTGVATLALRTGAAVLLAYAVWEEREKRYVIRIEPPLELIRTGDFERDVTTNTAHFTALIEDLIRRYPDQWLWIHRRWHTRPPGEPDLYATPAVAAFVARASH